MHLHFTINAIRLTFCLLRRNQLTSSSYLDAWICGHFHFAGFYLRHSVLSFFWMFSITITVRRHMIGNHFVTRATRLESTSKPYWNSRQHVLSIKTMWQSIKSLNTNYWYGVIHKKVSQKTEDKMQEKMKVILQNDENLAHIYNNTIVILFAKKINLKSAFF